MPKTGLLRLRGRPQFSQSPRLSAGVIFLGPASSCSRFACAARTLSAEVISLGPASSCSRLLFMTTRYLSAYAYLDPQHSACGDLGVLRGVERRGEGEDPWLSVPVFRRVWLCRCFQSPKYSTWMANRKPVTNVRCGSLAAPQNSISSTAAIECKPVVPQRPFKNQNLNVRFSRKRSFR